MKSGFPKGNPDFFYVYGCEGYECGFRAITFAVGFLYTWFALS